MDSDIIQLIVKSSIPFVTKFLASLFTRKRKTLYYAIITNPIECNNGIYAIEEYPINKHNDLEHAKYISTIAFWMDKNHSLTKYDVDYQCPTIIEIDKKYKIVSAKVLNQPQKACFCRPSLKYTESVCEVYFEYLDSDKGMLFLSILHSAPDSNYISVEPNINVKETKRIYANKFSEILKAGIFYVLIDIFILAMSVCTYLNEAKLGDIFVLLAQVAYVIVTLATFIGWVLICRYNSFLPKLIKEMINSKRHRKK